MGEDCSKGKGNQDGGKEKRRKGKNIYNFLLMAVSYNVSNYFENNNT